MKIVLLSDTHGGHEGLRIPECDLLAHAGDWSRHGTIDEAIAFFEWFGAQPARARIATAGNHDVIAETDAERIRALAEKNGVFWKIEAGCELVGMKIWASPYSPRHGSWAFQAERGNALRAHWDAIPEHLDLLITHAPPYGIGDSLLDGRHVGCEALREIVLQRAPRLHLFGHVHEAHGETRLDGVRTHFVNASNFVSTRVRSAPNLDVRQPYVVTL